MALVAYSDESDYSENESEDNSLNNATPKIKSKNLTITTNKETEFHLSMINSEEDITCHNGEDNSSICVSHLLSFIPAPLPVGEAKSHLDVTEDTDIVNDVPTVNTWNITKNISNSDKSNANIIANSSKKERKNNSNKNKLRLVLPALSEFDDEEEEEEESVDESSRKKIKASSGGTGLFAILPKPRGPLSLVPHHISKNQKRTQFTKPKVVPKSVLNTINDSDEEDLLKSDSKDFFSLDSIAPIVPEALCLASVPSLNQPLSDVIFDSLPSNSEPQIHLDSSSCEELPPVAQPAENLNPANSLSSSGIDEKALQRLAGRRNKKEIPNIININADDALMSREEWVNRALCDEKPRKSFSKKKEGNPTQQQKRKHQITYLAHQAQEREQELQNTWGQNRFTKMQTQSKYGF